MCGSRGAATRRPSLFRMVGEKMFKSAKPAVVSAWAAHGLAWIAGIFLAFGPVYSGSSSSLVEKNGLYVIWLLLVPVLLTGIVVLVVRRADISQMRRFLLLWGSAVLLLGLCAVSILSIGVFYLPAALALVFTAFTYPRGRSVALGSNLSIMRGGS